MQEFNPSSEHNLVKESIIKAGKLALKWFKKDPEQWKKDDGTIVSKADIENRWSEITSGDAITQQDAAKYISGHSNVGLVARINAFLDSRFDVTKNLKKLLN